MNTNPHLPIDLKDQSLGAINSIVVTCTAPGTAVNRAGISSLDVLEKAKADSSKEDAAWKQRLKVVFTAARTVSKLEMVLVEPYF
jgi:hypothetical protein